MAFFRLGVLVVVAAALLAPVHAVAQSPSSEIPCTRSVQFTSQGSSITLIAHDGQHSIRVCYYSLSLGANATTNAQIVWGTQTSTPCDTSKASLSPKMSVGSSVAATNVPVTGGTGLGFIDESPTRGGSDVCLVVAGGSPRASGMVRYGLY